MIHAYPEVFLDDAMDTLGGAVEHATLFCDVDGQEFIDLFLTSGIAHEFGRGNVKYISGMSGIELARLILEKCGKPLPEIRELPYSDYPPEYWIGWILAYYQWYTDKSFADLCRRLKFSALYDLYGVLHEADPRKAVDVFDSILAADKETNLVRIRKSTGLSQSQLVKKAEVSARSIQLYEQKQNDISHAQYNHLKDLARALGCGIEDILE